MYFLLKMVMFQPAMLVQFCWEGTVPTGVFLKDAKLGLFVFVFCPLTTRRGEVVEDIWKWYWISNECLSLRYFANHLLPEAKPNKNPKC